MYFFFLYMSYSILFLIYASTVKLILFFFRMDEGGEDKGKGGTSQMSGQVDIALENI